MIYLDHAATTPVPPEAAQAMLEALTKDFGNPSAQYAPGRQAKAIVDHGRAAIAGALGMASDVYAGSRTATRGEAASMLCRVLERAV